MEINKDKEAATGSKNDKMRLYYFFEMIYVALTIRFFILHPIDMSKPLDRILILILVFWVSIGFLIYEKKKYGKLSPKGSNACRLN